MTLGSIAVIAELLSSTPFASFPVEEKLVLTTEEFLATINFPDPLDFKVVQYILENPSSLYTLTPRKFEKFIANVVQELGYSVKLGKGSKDGGVDILAERSVPFGKELMIVQCKRNREDRKVEESTVKQLYTDIAIRDASRGLIVTTSDFTRGARKFMEMYKYKIDDFTKVNPHLRWGTPKV